MKYFFFFLFIGCGSPHIKRNESSIEGEVSSRSIQKDTSTAISYNPNQSEYNIPDFIEDAKLVMRILHIKTRKNIKQDGELKIIVSASMHDLDAMFGAQNDTITFDKSNYKYRVYKKPLIKISIKLDNILLGKKDTSELVVVKAKSHLIHELVHYLQENSDFTSPDKLSLLNKRDYVKLKAEKEAFGVSAYYFLKIYDEKGFNEIISLNKGDKLIESLINKYVQYVYPSWDKIFATDL